MIVFEIMAEGGGGDNNVNGVNEWLKIHTGEKRGACVLPVWVSVSELPAPGVRGRGHWKSGDHLGR